MSVNNTVESIREHVVIFGKELEFATGIRAMAAEKIMRERGIMDPDDLFVACEDLIEGANLFESYDSPTTVLQINTRASWFSVRAARSPRLRRTSPCVSTTVTSGPCSR